ncbi:MAG: hypothetical protein FJW38_09200 [Acidobacteria bacterium]|nr:hypothetical protein [Acidobacteriota bacterium]
MRDEPKHPITGDIAGSSTVTFTSTPSNAPSPVEAGQAYQPGARLAHYEIVKRIGVGAMGEVYLAQDTKLFRPVAVKILPRRFLKSPERVARFQREAQAASKLNHPNILIIHEIGHEGETHFMVTEFIEGENLRDRLRSTAGPLSILDAVRVAEQMTAALSVAHEAGIIHRDLKPENVMIRPDGLLKVLDFGLAGMRQQPLDRPRTPVTGSSDQTSYGQVMGTPKYMSPEQTRGEFADERSDVFSLGVMLYEMLVGAQAFPGATAQEVMWRVAEYQPPPLPAKAAQLQPVVRQAMAKEAGQRYANMREFGDALAQVRRAAEPKPRTALLVGAVVLAAAMAVGAGLWFRKPAAGGAPRRLAGPGRDPRFSRDGKWLTYWVNAGPQGRNNKVLIVPTGGGEPQWLAPEMQHLRLPQWLPDGRVIFFQPLRTNLGEGIWLTVRPGARPVPVALGNEFYSRFALTSEAWTVRDGQLLLVSKESIWQQELPASRESTVPEARFIATTTGAPKYPRAGPEGSIYFSNVTSRDDLWSLPLNARGLAAGPPRRLTSDPASENGMTLPADASFVVFDSNRSGVEEIWHKNLATGELRALTRAQGSMQRPLLHPDERQVVFQNKASKALGLYWMNLSGGLPRKFSNRSKIPLSWCPDGRSVLTTEEKNTALLCVDVETGAERTVLKSDGLVVSHGVYSPDKQWIAMHVRTGSETRRIWIAPVDARGVVAAPARWIPLTDGSTAEFNPRWSVDSLRVYWAGGASGPDGGCIFMRPLDPVTRQPTSPRLEVFRPERTSDVPHAIFALARDRVVFSLTNNEGNIWRLKSLKKRCAMRFQRSPIGPSQAAQNDESLRHAIPSRARQQPSSSPTRYPDFQRSPHSRPRNFPNRSLLIGPNRVVFTLTNVESNMWRLKSR